MTNEIKFKEVKTIEQQLDLLERNKRVIFESIDRETAGEILYTKNYINVISPFKYDFALHDEKDPDLLVKLDGKHVYPHETDFGQYYDLYLNERTKYSKLYSGISRVEVTFSSIMSYHILTHYKINCSTSFNAFIDEVIGKAKSSDIDPEKNIHNLKILTVLKEDALKYNNYIIFLDRLTLGESLIVFQFLPLSIKKKILSKMSKRRLSLGVDDIKTFESRMFKLVAIRNCVFHSNSLTILVRYYRIKDKILRSSSDRKTFINIIDFLMSI